MNKVLKKLKLINILLLFIILIAAFLRLYQLDAIPGSLNPDEAALGYNAYTLLKTGADEHGKFFPMSLQSFGDWKLPVYSYLDTVPIALFGLLDTSVRLPSVIAGTLSVFLIYLLTFQIFKNKTQAILSSLFLALNPWSIFFSRGAYEVNVATFIFLCGALLFTIFINTKKYKFLTCAFALFGLTMFTQHNFIVFSPLFVLVVLFLFRKKYSWNRQFILSIAFFVVLILGSYLSLSQGGSKKTSNLNLFNNKNIIYNRAEKLRGDGANKNKLLEKFLYNKYTAGTYQLALNYLSAYSPNVLLDKGGERLTHNIGKVGYFYIFDAFLFLIGIGILLWKREKNPLLILLPWLLIAPIPSAITTEHTGTRLFTMMPPFIIIVSYGAFAIYKYLRNSKLKLTALTIFTFLYFVSVIYFLQYYFVHFNIQNIRFWRYGNKQAVELVNKYPNYKVVVRGPEDFRYIYFLFYEKYDPIRFRKEVTYYPITDEGFLHVKSFGRHEFVNSVDYNNMQPGTIYIDDRDAQNLQHTINLPSGEPILGYTISEDVKK